MITSLSEVEVVVLVQQGERLGGMVQRLVSSKINFLAEPVSTLGKLHLSFCIAEPADAM
jgi:hypothetical protein